MNTIDKLTAFVNQRPGLDYANYGDSAAYNKESREITNDRNQYFELLSFAIQRYSIWNDHCKAYHSTLETVLTEYLTNTGDRLSLVNGKIEYVTGQYFCTEYRPAACRVLANLIWASFRDEVNANDPNPVYPDGHAMRAAIGKNLSRSVCKNYFN